MLDGTMILTMTNVVVVTINVVVNAIVDGKLCLVVNCINDGVFKDYRPYNLSLISLLNNLSN